MLKNVAWGEFHRCHSLFLKPYLFLLALCLISHKRLVVQDAANEIWLQVWLTSIPGVFRQLVKDSN